MIFAPHSYQCKKCLHLFTISSESFTGKPFIKCEKIRCDGLAERVDYSYLRDRTESKCKYPLTAILIRDARLRSGLEQKEFIERYKLDVSQATFSRWESGQIQVSAGVLFKLGLVKPAINLAGIAEID